MKAGLVPIGSKVVFAGLTLVCKHRERGFTRFSSSSSSEVYLPNDIDVYHYDLQMDLFNVFNK